MGTEWAWIKDLEKRGCEDHERKRLIACIRELREALELVTDEKSVRDDTLASYSVRMMKGRAALARCKDGKFTNERKET